MSKENFINNDNGFQRFCHISLDASNKHAPRKKKHARGNQIPSLIKNYQKQYWYEINYETFSYKIGVRKTKCDIKNNEILVSLF